MDTYYLLVKVSPNPNAEDAITVGMIAWFRGRYWVRFSSRRLRISRHLSSLSGNSYQWIFKQIEEKIQEENERTVGEGLLSPAFLQTSLLNRDYFTRLSSYSSGWIRFSEPRSLDLNFNAQKAEQLFRVLVDDSEVSQPKPKPTPPQKDHSEELRELINEKLIAPLKDRVNTHFSISPSFDPVIYFDLELDVIGKNGSLFVVKSMDFSASYSTIDAALGHFSYTINLLDNSYSSGTDNRYFLIADEPEDPKSKVAKAWEAVNLNRLIEVVSSQKAGSVADLIISAGAEKFLEDNQD